MPSQYADRPKPARLHGQAAAGSPPLHPPRPEQQEQLPCPRCDSTNTKFCYYNNYNLSQPRHFCKSCRRYWTRGGTLRDIPVGGGTRRNSKRSRTSAPALPPLDGSVVIHGSLQSSGVAAEAPKPVCGSFASLLATQGPACFLALGGVGRLGLEDMAFGLGRGATASWAFHGEAGGGAAAAGSGREEAFGMGGTWQLESGVEGGGDCFNFPGPTWPFPFPAATGLK